MNNKIVNQKKIVSIADFFKKNKELFVVVSGSFDILHARHADFLKKAKSQGKYLIVLLNSDQSIKKYKGLNRPIVPEKLRAELLASLSCVDYVCLFNEITPNKLLEKIKPNIYCNGPDWGSDCIEKEVVEKNGGRIVVIRGIKRDITSSKIILKILTAYKTPQIKAVFIDRDGTINDDKDGYIYKINDFVYLPGVIKGLKKLSQSDYKIIIISNQSGIGRGFYKENDFTRLNKFMLKDLKHKNIRIDKVYYCPHKPEDKCLCRKPEGGMIFKALEDFKISLNDSWLIGDSESDVALGRNLNIKTIKVSEKKKSDKLKANYYVNNLETAVKIILG